VFKEDIHAPHITKLKLIIVKKIIKLTESDLNRIVGKVLLEQSINNIIDDSNQIKNTDTFCKSKTDYDICLAESSTDRSILYKKYNSKYLFLQNNGYKMIEESSLRLNPEGVYTKSSIWKK